MPIEFWNSPGTFQTLLNNIVHACFDEIMMIYMHDLLIFTKDKENHYKHLEIDLSRWKEHDLHVAPQKCELFEENIEFFGLLIGNDGLLVKLDKVEILKTWLMPTSVKTISTLESNRTLKPANS